MKQTKLNLNGKELSLRFDLGAIEDFCEDMDVDFSEFNTKALQSPKGIRYLIYHMAIAGGSEVTLEELKRLEFSELNKFTEFISGDGKGKAGKGK